MAETYDVVMAVKVLKTSTKEAMVEEEFYFNDQSFAKMANLADKFYELTAAMKKIK